MICAWIFIYYSMILDIKYLQYILCLEHGFLHEYRDMSHKTLKNISRALGMHGFLSNHDMSHKFHKRYIIKVWVPQEYKIMS